MSKPVSPQPVNASAAAVCPVQSAAAEPSLGASEWELLNREIVACQLCPRLRDHCRRIAEEKRRAYLEHSYWGAPVPNFVSGTGVAGPSQASSQRSVLIVGLAPGAHGANRTGRMFTGDRSGDWLYRALHRAGLATQSASIERLDGLQLIDAVVTAVCHCAPPDNKPSVAEIDNCRPFLEQTIALAQPKAILALGKLAWTAVMKLARQNPGLFQQRPVSGGRAAPRLSASSPPLGQAAPWSPAPAASVLRPVKRSSPPPVPGQAGPNPFGHGRVARLGGVALVGCYHPSQQNTFTKRLTEAMLDEVVAMVVGLAAANSLAEDVT